MNKRPNSRPSWVWAALALQFVLLSLTAYGCVQVLALWSRYAASGMGAQLAVRVFFPAAMIAVSLIGLWRTRRWGWILALVADGALCAQTLWFLLDYAPRAVRNARWLAFNIWEGVPQRQQARTSPTPAMYELSCSWLNKQMGLTPRGLPIPYNRNRTPARPRSPSSFDSSNALCNNPAWRKLLRGCPCLLSTANSQLSVASPEIRPKKYPGR
jgi:hypothetical protein